MVYTYHQVKPGHKQYNLFETRDQFGQPLYEVRQDRGNNIDFTKAFNNIA